MILNAITPNITMTAIIWKTSLLLMTWFCYLFEERATFAGLEIVSSIKDESCQGAYIPSYVIWVTLLPTFGYQDDL